MILLIVGRVVVAEGARGAGEATRSDGQRLEEARSTLDRGSGASSRDPTSAPGGPPIASAQPKSVEHTEVAVVPLKDLAEHPEKYRDRRVRVTGRLENIGPDYFRAPQVVLKDTSGHFIDVRPWLPAALPPLPPGVETAPPTMSDYLGKRVELTGVLREVSGEDTKPFYWLTVESAQLL